MSKFADKLKHSQQNVAPSMGFRKSEVQSERVPMLLISDLTGAGEANIKNMVKGGIDAAIVNSNKTDVTACNKLVKTLGDIPLGVLFEDNSGEKIPDYADSKCDFIIFDVNTPAGAVSTRKSGNILKVDTSMMPNIARAINGLTVPVDGVFIINENTAVTIEYLLICKSFSELLNKPLIAGVNSTINDAELTGLYESGVKGLVVPGNLPLAKISGFKKVIGELPKISKQKTKHSALLPQLGSIKGTEDDEDIEEDD
jgi:hypothetical protein